LRQLIRVLISHFVGFLIDVVNVFRSKETLKQLLNIPLYSNALYLLVSRVLDPVMGFVFWAIAARLYSSMDIGLASAVIAAGSLLAMIANLGLGFGLIRFLPGSGKKANSLINSCFSLSGMVSVVAAIVFLAGLSLWSPALLFIRESPVYLVAFFIFVATFTLSQHVDQTFMIGRRGSFILIRGIIFNLFRLSLLVVMAAMLPSRGIFGSWTISLAVALLVVVIFFLPRSQPGYRPSFTINKKVLSEIMHFSFANYLSLVLGSAPGFVLPLLVVNLLGAEFNAYFYISWAVGNVLSIISYATSTSLFVEGSYDEATLRANAWRSLKMVGLLVIPALVLVLALADKVLLIFGGSYAENGTTLLRIVAISSIPFSVNVTYLATKRVEKKLKVLVVLPAIIMVITLILAYFLLPVMGISGAGIAWLAGHTVITLGILGVWLKNMTRNVDD
jgi:O-antigen/teichoic acid export membrane protein